MAREFAAENTRVNAVAPGSIYFPGGSWERRQAGQPALFEQVLESILAGRLGRPEEVADVVTFLASARARWVNGACLVVDGYRSAYNL